MNITPLEIRQKVFEKAFRGYDKDEVTAFLNSMSIEWEKLNDQNKELVYKLEGAEKEVSKLREVENSLFRTLKTAEDTGANMVEQATKTAELHMKETEMNADAMMNEAKSRAKSIIEDAEVRARSIVDDMEDEIRELEQVFRSVNANKTTLMSDLKILANDILDKLQRHEDFPAEIKSHVKKGKDLIREVNEVNGQNEIVKIVPSKKDKVETTTKPVEEKEATEVIEEVEEKPKTVTEKEPEEQVELAATTDEAKEDVDKVEPEEKKKTKNKGSKEEEESFFDQFD